METRTQLRTLVNQTIKSVLPSAITRRSFIINDIPSKTFLEAEEEAIVVIFTKLLDNIIKSSYQGCIRISFIQEGTRITILLKDNNSDYSQYISGKLLKVSSLVKKIGGEVNFEFNQRRSIKIVLNFTYCEKAA